MNKPINLIPAILIVQNLQFSYFLINQVKYFLVLNLDTLFYYDVNEIEQDKFIKNKVLINFQSMFLWILNE